jgi:hypothetical protein
MVPFPRRLPHTISLLEGDGFEPSVPRQKDFERIFEKFYRVHGLKMAGRIASLASVCAHQNVDVVFRFAHDSPLEEGGFELSVPRDA